MLYHGFSERRPHTELHLYYPEEKEFNTELSLLCFMRSDWISCPQVRLPVCNHVGLQPQHFETWILDMGWTHLSKSDEDSPQGLY